MMRNLLANWPAPAAIRALTTTREGGLSELPYNSNNLALHVGDNQDTVEKNRQRLIDSLQLPASPSWLEQTHSTQCILVESTANRQADAAITRNPQVVLAIMTADCLPILLCNRAGTEIAAIHAGWRGLVNGIVESTLSQLKTKPSECIAWIGPAICSACYETGEEVTEAYCNKYPFTAPTFKKQGARWHADLPLMAEKILLHHGLQGVHQSNMCTFEQSDRFFSYRRQSQTGRIASLIWFNQRGSSYEPQF